MLISVGSTSFTVSRYFYLVYEGLSMKMDCVYINLVTHSQQVPAHPLSLVHGQPRQVGIEPAVDCCAGNNTEGKRLLVKSYGCCTSSEEGGRLAVIKLIQHPVYQQLVSPTGQSPQLSYLSTLLTARKSDLHSRPCCSSAQINLKNYLC